MKKILVHCCCAPDALYCLRYILDEGLYSPEAYFYNPNIYPPDEHDLRLKEVEKVCDELGIPLHTEPYEPLEFEKISDGFQDEPEGGYRCALCYDLRLVATARKAKELKLDSFTAVLTISPHKSSDLVKYFGRKNGEDFDVDFIFYDFKKKGGFQESVAMSRKLNLYRQNYCGCEFSIKD